LRVSAGTVYKLFHAGVLRGPQMGRSVRIYAKSIPEYLERVSNRPKEKPPPEPLRPRPKTYRRVPGPLLNPIPPP
jgi:excisionase family DNA binding protein